MYVISVCTYLNKIHLVPLAYLQTYLLQFIVHFIRKYHPPILGSTHYMVEYCRDIVTLV